METEAPRSVTGEPSTWRRFWAFPGTRIVTFLLLLAALNVAIGLPLTWMLHVRHVTFRRDPEVGDLLNEALGAILTLVAFLIMVRWADRRTFVSAGLTRRGWLAETGSGFLIGTVVFSAAVALTAAFGAYRVTTVNHHFQALIPLVLFFFVAVVEEVIFRGYVLQTLEARWGSGIALAGSATAFGLIHLLNPIGGLTLAEKLAGPVFIVFEAGLLLAASFLLTRRLWLPIGIHWGWNFFESAIYGTADSGMPVSVPHTLLFSHTAGPFLLTGGPFGPEAGLPCLLAGTVAGLILLRLTIRKGQWRPRHPQAPLLSTDLQEVLS